jgi:hypothetical protein
VLRRPTSANCRDAERADSAELLNHERNLLN